MLYSTLFAATALVGAATAVDHKVSVSDKSGALIFMPDSIVAAQGDTVSYHFWPKNHSVAQSTFAEPCAPMANGFWSGYVATASMDAAAKEVFTYEVKNASAPIWFYCTQGKHCQGGMVGVINPPKSGPNTLAAYKTKSGTAEKNVAPVSANGFGGKLSATGGNSTSGSASPSGSGKGGASASGSGAPAQSTGGASQLAGSAAFAGLSGLFAYILV